MKLGNYIVIISHFVKPVNGDSKFYFALVTKSQKLLEHHRFVFGGSEETQTEKSKVIIFNHVTILDNRFQKLQRNSVLCHVLMKPK